MQGLVEIWQVCAFYIGGTKCGAMFGEAVVFPDGKRADRFFSHIKRHGALLAKGYTQPVDSPTNQQFIEISLQQAEELKQHITYGEWEPPRGDKVTIRLATSWATNPEDVDKLIELL